MNIEKMIGSLTVDEKIRLLAGASFWSTHAVERLGVPSVTLTDGPHGVRLSTGTETGEILSYALPATAFPIEAAMASTWNDVLIRKMGGAIAEECQYYDVGILLGPGLNGKRSPLGGRNFEYFSEDPYLTGRMGVAFVRGVQEGGVGTCIKHYIANEQETNRMVVSSEVDERALREIYLYPFEMVVRDAKPWTVMSAYNRVNGEHMSHNGKYLTNVLKQEWGFDGLVMSDWGAVVDKVASVQGGLDLEMPGPGMRDAEVLEAYCNRLITDEQLDDHVRRILRVIQAVEEGKKEVTTLDVERHHAIAREIAEEAIILLKNEGSLLPLSKEAKVAVLGKFAKNPRYQGGGSSHMNPTKLDIPLDEIAKFAQIVYGDGYENDSVNDALLQEARRLAADQDVVVVFVGTTEEIESEGYDRLKLNLPPSHSALIQTASEANENVVVIVNSGSATLLGDYDPYAKAVLQAWLPGQAGGSALANILFGHTNPSGKLSETFPRALEHNPSFLSFPGDIRQTAYTEGIFTGYRYYDAKKLEVKYPFGFGLSYTKFDYSNMRLSAEHLHDGETLYVDIDIRNPGSVTGKEVVQVYVCDIQSSVRKAHKELKGFDKIELSPGEGKTVRIELTASAFSHYAEHLGKFVVESGEFEILAGSSSRDIHLSGRIAYTSSEDASEPLTSLHSLREWSMDERHRDKVDFILGLMKVYPRNPLYPLVLGMPIRTAMKFLPSDISGETTAEIQRMFGID